MPKRSAKHRREGTGILGKAWIVVATLSLVVVFALSSELFRPAEMASSQIILPSEPERFARISEPQSPTAPLEVTQAGAEVPSEAPKESTPSAEANLPVVIRDQPTERPSPETEAAALALEGDQATVIRLEELPSAQSGSSQATTSQSGPNTDRPIVLPRAPLTALLRETRYGNVPQISNDGKQALYQYRRIKMVPDDAPKIAVIVAGLGLSTTLTEQAINNLPADVSFAFAPYAKDLSQWTGSAREAGHELVLELPMAAGKTIDQDLGSAALSPQNSVSGNSERLNWLLARFEGYVAVTNYLGASLARDEAAFGPILQQITSSGLGFVVDTEMSRHLVARSSVPVGLVDILIPNSAGSISTQLQKAENIALQKRRALVKIYPTPSSLTELQAWTETLGEQNIHLVPASALIIEAN